MAESQEHQGVGVKNNAAEIISAQHSAQLCQACGMCCTGALFSHVNITQKEAEALKGTVIETYPGKNNKPVFAQPCLALSGTSCTIYDKRPGSCRAFLCDLTRNVMNGRTDIAAAHEAVSEMKVLMAWLIDNVPPDTHAPPSNASTEMRSRVERIFKAWQNSENDKQDGTAEVSASTKGLWRLLTELEPRFSKNQANEALSAAEKEYITHAFAFAKLCDRVFTKTILLRKYGQLVQQF